MLSQPLIHRKTYQKLLFSATLTHNPEILQQLNLFRPVLFASLSTSSIAMPSTLREQFVVCSITYKPLIIAYLILNQLQSEKIMIFVHSKKDVDRLTSLLKLLLPDKIKVSQISRNLPSQKIQTRLTMFESGRIRIIVCSDVLAYVQSIASHPFHLSLSLLGVVSILLISIVLFSTIFRRIFERILIVLVVQLVQVKRVIRSLWWKKNA